MLAAYSILSYLLTQLGIIDEAFKLKIFLLIFLIYMLIYLISYRLSSRTYYKIVSY